MQVSPRHRSWRLGLKSILLLSVPSWLTRKQRFDRLPLGHPEVVTLEPVQDEELDYAEAAPLVVEWRPARAAA